jgi:hypothetical protein
MAHRLNAGSQTEAKPAGAIKLSGTIAIALPERLDDHRGAYAVILKGRTRV